jgi:hypothetical protein
VTSQNDNPPSTRTLGLPKSLRAERLGGFLPFVWYATRTKHWLKLLASGRYDITANRLLNVLGVSLMAPPSSAMFHLSEAIFRRRAEAVEIVPPLFVLGHWRSGTSFLHKLLTLDPEAAFPTTFECVFPDGFLVAEPALWWALSPFLPKTRPMDAIPMGSAEPFEDEFALVKLGLLSPYAALAFPRHGPPAFSSFDVSELPESDRRTWEAGFLWFMRRLQLAHPGRRLVLKSPPHTARIAALLKLFPEARFVHIARNPYEIDPSTLRLWKILNSRLGLQNPANDDGWLPEHVLATLPRLYAAYERDRPLIPAGHLVEIRYEELVTDPKAALESIYARLGLGDFALFSSAVDVHLDRLGPHRPGIHQLDDVERRAIQARWQPYFDRFGYA